MIKLFVIFCITLSLNGSELLKLYVNKNHTFITFIESLSEARYVSIVPKRIYLSKYKNDIEKFVNLHKKISKARINKYKGTKSLLSAMYIESLKYKKFSGFEKSIRSYKIGLKQSDINKYFNYLHKLYPRFEKIIWKKTSRGVIYRKNKLEKMMKEKNFDKLVNKILHFYNVKAKDVGVMNVAFYPIAYGKRINAYSIGNTESIGIFVGKSQNLNWMLSSTILHELEHTIYRKSKFVQNNFLNIKDKKRNTTINEVFATAIGAGWGYKNLTGIYPVRSWYANKTYNKFGKKIYPMITEYLDNGKKIDKKFARFIKSIL